MQSLTKVELEVKSKYFWLLYNLPDLERKECLQKSRMENGNIDAVKFIEFAEQLGYSKKI